MSDQRYCPMCGKTVPLERFTRNKAKTTGFGSYCKACATSLMSKRREEGKA